MLLDYRKDIDGLRAIAVLLVVLFHLGFPISGGFIGVDIFFVISGFLIASLIQKQILRDKFSFKGFYLHRMRRILPALLTVIIVTFIAGWFLLMPEEFNFFISSIIYSLIGFSNIFFYKKGSDYFAADTDTIQLLHTWSLGVEEQFYFIIPIFLILLFKFFYKTKWFNIILLGLFIIGLGLSQYLAETNKAYAYYLLPARFFELLMGVILALNFSKLPVISNKKIANVLSLIAILLIFVPAFYISKENTFPGVWAFAVCLGSCLVIYLGKLEEKTCLTKILSVKPVVFIGLISYSLYLWHWSVISIANAVGLHFNYFEKSAILIVLIAISYLSWKFIEQPFRNKFKFGFLITFIFLLLIPALTAQLLKDSSRKNHAFQDYRFYGSIKNLVQSSQGNVGKMKKYCHGNYYSLNDDSKCVIGDKEQKVSALIFGDSHANAISPALEIMLEKSNIKAKMLTDDATLYLRGIDRNKASSFLEKEKAARFVNLIEQQIESKKYEYVIFSANFLAGIDFHGNDNFIKKLEDTILFIQSKGAEVVIVKDIYAINDTNVYCAIYKKMFKTNKQCNNTLSELQKRNSSIDKIFDYLENKYHKSVIFIDPKKVICDDKFCYTSINDTIIFRDSGHLSFAGSKYIGIKYLEEYGNPFIKK